MVLKKQKQVGIHPTNMRDRLEREYWIPTFQHDSLKVTISYIKVSIPYYTIRYDQSIHLTLLYFINSSFY